MPDRAEPPISPIDPGVAIGHVHLKVADLDRALAFYRDALGFGVTGRIGDAAAFLAAGGYHHHIGLNASESRGGTGPPPGATGLHHVAVRYPHRGALAAAVRRLLAHGVAIGGAADHGGSESVYLADPDGNGIELTWDRDPAAWPRDGQGALRLVNEPLALAELLAEAGPVGTGRR